MSPEKNSRRSLLSAIATIGAGSVAGCVEGIVGESASTTETEGRATTTTEPGPSVDASRMAAVGPPDADGESKDVEWFDLRSLRANRSQFDYSTVTRFDDLPVPEAVDRDAVEKLVTTSNPDVRLAFGSFDPEGVGERRPEETVGSHEGFALYGSGDDGRRWLGVSETVVLEGPDRDGLERAIDALDGDGDRMTGAVEAYASVLQAIGDGAYARARVYPEPARPDGYGPDAEAFEGVRCFGLAIAFEGDTAALTLALEYDTDVAGHPSEAELDDWLEQEAASAGSPLATYEDRSVSVEGSTAVVTASTPIAKFDFFTPRDPTRGDDESVPAASFDFDYDRDAGEVTIGHLGGDAIPAERLTITVDGEPADRQFADVTDVVEAGDTVTVAVEPGETVKVVYDTEELSETIGLFETPA